MKSIMKVVFMLSIIMCILLTPTMAKGVSHGTKASIGSGGSGTASTTSIRLARARPRTTTNNTSSSTSVGWSSMTMASASLAYLTFVYF
ncbi:hypothetical protein RND71_030063 [Anisodus tanguticus]|uniref:Uncharacterized protein n=1 Tax=Anisodus tanguticus TaxID=243964 RepID=A0AAE1REL0_9SOLA|nr:hypothetical protein RND71_030063 [Anisodus tanguticus]